MGPRTRTALYQTASRAWLTLAGLSLLLPADRRLGLWLPLHLTLAGAASVAISGAMQNFAGALTATESPPALWVWLQFIGLNAGVASIALGRTLSHPAFVAVGGTCFTACMTLLLWFVLRAWKTALNKRHALPMRIYIFAASCVIVGAALGALMGSGAVQSGTMYNALRYSHITLNLLGWVSATIVGTLVTLLPSTLRVQMPTWHGSWTAGALMAGVLMLALGFAFRITAAVALGGLCELFCALGVSWMVFKALRKPRQHPVPSSALHLVAGVVWFTVGSVALALSSLRGVSGFDVFYPTFLTMFVGGWVVQVLLGAWSYLLPTGRAGDPNLRRTWLAAMESLTFLQLGAMNVGIALMALSAAGWVGPALRPVGTALAVGGGTIALAKAWFFPALARVSGASPRGERVWSRLDPPQDASG